MAIRIPFVADVAAFLKGTRNMEDALDDVEDALDELGRNTSTQRLEDDLRAVGVEAGTAAEKLETSFTSAFDKLKAEGRTATRRVRADVDDVGDKGSASLREFSAEAKQNVAESVSSFTGSASSAVDAIQSTFGGLVSALGPAGVIGAAAAAAGIGMARGLFEKSQEQAEALRERIAAIFDEMVQNQNVITDAFRNDAIRDLIDDGDRFKDLFGTDLLTASRIFGRDLSTILRGLTGDSHDMAVALELVQGRQADLATSTRNYVDEAGNVIVADQEQAKAVALLNLALGGQGEALTEAQVKAQIYAAAAQDAAAATDDTTEALDENAEAVKRNPLLKGEAKESLWDLRDALAEISGKLKDGGKSLNQNTKAGRDNWREIKNAVDAVNAYGDAQLAATGDVQGTNAKLKEQSDALVNRVAKAFGITRGQARDYINTLGGIPRKKQTDVQVSDNGTAKATSDRVDAAAKDRTSTVEVVPDMSGVDRGIRNYFDGKVYQFNVAPRPGKSVGV